MIRLKWKIALSTFILIILVIIGLYLPNYWQTRIVMEKQLQDHLVENLTLIADDMDNNLLPLLESQSVQQKFKQTLEKYYQNLAAESIYLFDDKGILLAVAGNQNNAVKSLMLNAFKVKRHKQWINNPAFEDNRGEFYLSVFRQLSETYYLGISANAEYLKELAQLRRQMIILSLSILAITLVGTFIFSITLTKPLQKLTQFARQIGRGQQRKIDFSSRTDEMGILYNSMLEMQQQIQQREKENKQIVASVAHELRNPIAGMQINSELLLEKVTAGDEKYAAAIHQDLAKLAEIVDSFLNYSRSIDANLEPVCLLELLTEILKTNHFAAYADRIVIHGDGIAKIHASKMKHVFINLLNNGLEASPETEKIEINILQQPDHIRITLKNIGTPIDPETRSQIFEAFFSTKENGVGLGLPIAKSIVEQHGGELFLEKSDETGTLFVITLPREKNARK